MFRKIHASMISLFLAASMAVSSPIQVLAGSKKGVDTIYLGETYTADFTKWVVDSGKDTYTKIDKDAQQYHDKMASENTKIDDNLAELLRLATGENDPQAAVKKAAGGKQSGVLTPEQIEALWAKYNEELAKVGYKNRNVQKNKNDSKYDEAWEAMRKAIEAAMHFNDSVDPKDMIAQQRQDLKAAYDDARAGMLASYKTANQIGKAALQIYILYLKGVQALRKAQYEKEVNALYDEAQKEVKGKIWDVYRGGGYDSGSNLDARTWTEEEIKKYYPDYPDPNCGIFATKDKDGNLVPKTSDDQKVARDANGKPVMICPRCHAEFDSTHPCNCKKDPLYEPYNDTAYLSTAKPQDTADYDHPGFFASIFTNAKPKNYTEQANGTNVSLMDKKDIEEDKKALKEFQELALDSGLDYETMKKAADETDFHSLYVKAFVENAAERMKFEKASDFIYYIQLNGTEVQKKELKEQYGDDVWADPELADAQTGTISRPLNKTEQWVLDTTGKDPYEGMSDKNSGYNETIYKSLYDSGNASIDYLHTLSDSEREKYFEKYPDQYPVYEYTYVTADFTDEDREDMGYASTSYLSSLSEEKRKEYFKRYPDQEGRYEFEKGAAAGDDAVQRVSGDDRLKGTDYSDINNAKAAWAYMMDDAGAYLASASESGEKASETTNGEWECSECHAHFTYSDTDPRTWGNKRNMSNGAWVCASCAAKLQAAPVKIEAPDDTVISAYNAYNAQIEKAGKIGITAQAIDKLCSYEGTVTASHINDIKNAVITWHEMGGCSDEDYEDAIKTLSELKKDPSSAQGSALKEVSLKLGTKEGAKDAWLSQLNGKSKSQAMKIYADKINAIYDKMAPYANKADYWEKTAGYDSKIKEISDTAVRYGIISDESASYVESNYPFKELAMNASGVINKIDVEASWLDKTPLSSEYKATKKDEDLYGTGYMSYVTAFKNGYKCTPEEEKRLREMYFIPDDVEIGDIWWEFTLKIPGVYSGKDPVKVTQRDMANSRQTTAADYAKEGSKDPDSTDWLPTLAGPTSIASFKVPDMDPRNNKDYKKRKRELEQTYQQKAKEIEDNIKQAWKDMPKEWDEESAEKWLNSILPDDQKVTAPDIQEAAQNLSDEEMEQLIGETRSDWIAQQSGSEYAADIKAQDEGLKNRIIAEEGDAISKAEFGWPKDKSAWSDEMKAADKKLRELASTDQGRKILEDMDKNGVFAAYNDYMGVDLEKTGLTEDDAGQMLQDTLNAVNDYMSAHTSIDETIKMSVTVTNETTEKKQDQTKRTYLDSYIARLVPQEGQPDEQQGGNTAYGGPYVYLTPSYTGKYNVEKCIRYRTIINYVTVAHATVSVDLEGPDGTENIYSKEVQYVKDDESGWEDATRDNGFGVTGENAVQDKPLETISLTVLPIKSEKNEKIYDTQQLK